ncbi:hypothetical protein KAFR_0B01500 [Kazachstania africana CBS 2517]|uniref:Uncharacterized protein n=1 Tax=Kazachstania africana (strain ATCC 22294 / BCRC 22015 / CBS 2517 / CECT 1963 / NBRC 1671 / NRRL Y-8276) TaxID=1071382 RepID=H2APZ9_KAZAF|nr:hypothetical protein KAFR_0B01500 [Kazachstania africana CBS 2517]CCF56449.1 hypothetical protein KAFR_0B01500 [Kazachstania africana CBS 2517]
MDFKDENRRKFQDKQKLKNKHLTKSDRKYVNIKKTAEIKASLKEKEEQKTIKLGSNVDRYEEIEVEQTDDLDIHAINNKLKAKLPFSNDGPKSPKEPINTKFLKTMDINDLNELLGVDTRKTRMITKFPMKRQGPIRINQIPL